MTAQLYPKAQFFFKSSIYVLNNNWISKNTEKIDNGNFIHEKENTQIDLKGMDFYFHFPSLLGLSHSYELDGRLNERTQTIQLMLEIGKDKMPQNFQQKLLSAIKE